MHSEFSVSFRNIMPSGQLDGRSPPPIAEAFLCSLLGKMPHSLVVRSAQPDSLVHLPVPFNPKELTVAI